MPTATQSWRHIVLTLNGHQFVAFADEDPPVDFPNIDLLEYTIGRDGTLHTMDMGTRGGEVTIKLMPNSSSAARCIRWLTESLKDKDLDFSGVYTDSHINVSMRLVGGKLKSADPALVPGKNYEVTFVFEQLIPDADGAKNLAVPPKTGE